MLQATDYSHQRGMFRRPRVQQRHMPVYAHPTILVCVIDSPSIPIQGEGMKKEVESGEFDHSRETFQRVPFFLLLFMQFLYQRASDKVQLSISSTDSLMRNPSRTETMTKKSSEPTSVTTHDKGCGVEECAKLHS